MVLHCMSFDKSILEVVTVRSGCFTCIIYRVTPTVSFDDLNVFPFFFFLLGGGMGCLVFLSLCLLSFCTLRFEFNTFL